MHCSSIYIEGMQNFRVVVSIFLLLHKASLSIKKTLLHLAPSISLSQTSPSLEVCRKLLSRSLYFMIPQYSLKIHSHFFFQIFRRELTVISHHCLSPLYMQQVTATASNAPRLSHVSLSFPSNSNNWNRLSSLPDFNHKTNISNICRCC